VAVELVSRRRGDLLLIDHRLPDHFGTELVRQLRRNGNITPAVIIAARAEQGLNESAREAGGRGRSSSAARRKSCWARFGAWPEATRRSTRATHVDRRGAAR
jgi:CheY-like chemotaxis protein